MNKGVVSVSLRLKNLITSQRGKDIIHKAEIKLLNERVKNFNSTIEWLENGRYMYQNQLKHLVNKAIWDLCLAEMYRVKELRHVQVMRRQISKFEKLLQRNYHEDQGGHSNHDQNGSSNLDSLEMTRNVQKNWVINLFCTHLTQEQESPPAHGPNFAVSPQIPLYGEYIITIESTCHNLDNNTAEEWRAEVYRVLRHLKPNLSKDEMKAIK